MYKFSIIGGFIGSRQNVNIILKKNILWNYGQLIMNNKPIYNFDPTTTYNITHTKYNDLNTLLVNDAIIYQNKGLFTYNIDFELSQYNNYGKNNIYSCIEYVL